MSRSVSKNNDKSFLRKVKHKLKHGLLLNAVRTNLFRAGVDISPYYWYQEGLNISEIPEIHGDESGYTVELLMPDDIEKIEKIDEGWSESRDRISSLKDSSEKCLGIKSGGEIAAFMWINFREFRYKSTVVQLKENEAYLHSMFTVEDYRGKNLAPYLRYKSYELLRKMGKENIYSISIYFNTPAIKFKEKLNAKKLKLVFLIRFFNRYQLSFPIKSYI